MAPHKTKRVSVLITGCSPGGMGAALAIAFHEAGHRVFATARNPAKLAPLAERGIVTVTLDVTSAESIASAVASVTSTLGHGRGLDILINNAAGSYSMPVVDIALDKARQLFETNVWAPMAVTQAFLPLLLKSDRALVANHTSAGSVAAIPFQGVYNASKAALAMLTETMRMELSAFGIRVVDLKTGGVRSNLILNNNVNADSEGLPEGSIFGPARETVQRALSQLDLTDKQGISASRWAAEVSSVLLQRSPPPVVWKGSSAELASWIALLPTWVWTSFMRRMTKLDVVEEEIMASRKRK
jgi:1-acylglycerone phosphate reductase